MVFTFIKLRKKLEEERLDNALNDCLVLLKNQGLSNYKSQDYILDKWSEEKKRIITLHGYSSVDIIIEHIKREVSRE